MKIVTAIMIMHGQYLSIALGILKQVKDEFCRLGRPTTLSIGMSVLSLSSPSHTTTKAGEGNGLLVGQHIL